MRKRLLTVCLAALLAVPTAVLTAASAGARPAPCSRADLLFCEDFEHVRTGGATSLKWGVDTRDGTLTVERQGRNKVLHAHTVGNGKAFLRVDHFAAPGNSFHGRARIRVAAFPDSPDWAHYTLIETTGVGPEVIRPLGGQYVPTLDKALWGVGADGGPTGDWTNWRESAPSTAGVWQCVEWRMDAADNRITVWIDDQAKPDLTVSTKDHGGNPVDFLFPKFDAVKFGWQLYQPNSGTYDVWLDDLALGVDRLGC